MAMFLKRPPQPFFFNGIDLRKSHEIAVEHVLGFRAQYISQSAGHPGTKIQAERPKDNGHAAGHLLASVLAHTFHDGESAAVANGKAFARPAGDEELAGRSAIEDRVAGKNVAAP